MSFFRVVAKPNALPANPFAPLQGPPVTPENGAKLKEMAANYDWLQSGNLAESDDDQPEPVRKKNKVKFVARFSKLLYCLCELAKCNPSFAAIFPNTGADFSAALTKYAKASKNPSQLEEVVKRIGILDAGSKLPPLTAEAQKARHSMALSLNEQACYHNVLEEIILALLQDLSKECASIPVEVTVKRLRKIAKYCSYLAKLDRSLSKSCEETINPLLAQLNLPACALLDCSVRILERCPAVSDANKDNLGILVQRITGHGISPSQINTLLHNLNSLVGMLDARRWSQIAPTLTPFMCEAIRNDLEVLALFRKGQIGAQFLERAENIPHFQRTVGETLAQVVPLYNGTCSLAKAMEALATLAEWQPLALLLNNGNNLLRSMSGLPPVQNMDTFNACFSAVIAAAQPDSTQIHNFCQSLVTIKNKVQGLFLSEDAKRVLSYLTTALCESVNLPVVEMPAFFSLLASLKEMAPLPVETCEGLITLIADLECLESLIKQTNCNATLFQFFINFASLLEDPAFPELTAEAKTSLFDLLQVMENPDANVDVHQIAQFLKALGTLSLRNQLPSKGLISESLLRQLLLDQKKEKEDEEEDIAPFSPQQIKEVLFGLETLIRRGQVLHITERV